MISLVRNDCSLKISALIKKKAFIENNKILKSYNLYNF